MTAIHTPSVTSPEQNRSHHLRRAKFDLCRHIVAGACLVLCLVSSFRLACVVFVSAASSRVYDFAQEWTSARNWATGRPLYLDYSESLLIHFGSASTASFQYNAHPPASVLLALPFSWLAYRPAFLAWSVLSALCLVFSLWVILRDHQTRLLDLRWLVPVTFVATSSALMHQTVQGQLNLVLLALITGIWLADRREWSATSGVLIGLAAAIKLFPAFLVLGHLVQRKWHAVLGAAIAFFAVNGVGWALFGGQAYQDYFLRVAPGIAGLRDAWPNASLLGFWSKLFDGGFGQVLPVWNVPILAKVLAVLSCLVVVATTGWAAARVRKPSSVQEESNTDQDLVFALACAGMLLTSPITWDHYFLLLIPALVFAWRACDKGGVRKCLLSVIAIALVWLNPFSLCQAVAPHHFGESGEIRPMEVFYVLTVVSFQFYALLGFYLLVFAELRRRRRILNGARH